MMAEGTHQSELEIVASELLSLKDRMTGMEERMANMEAMLRQFLRDEFGQDLEDLNLAESKGTCEAQIEADGDYSKSENIGGEQIDLNEISDANILSCDDGRDKDQTDVDTDDGREKDKTIVVTDLEACSDLSQLLQFTEEKGDREEQSIMVADDVLRLGNFFPLHSFVLSSIYEACCYEDKIELEGKIGDTDEFHTECKPDSEKLDWFGVKFKIWKSDRKNFIFDPGDFLIDDGAYKVFDEMHNNYRKLVKESIGVVVLFLPWNYFLSMSKWKDVLIDTFLEEGSEFTAIVLEVIKPNISCPDFVHLPHFVNLPIFSLELACSVFLQDNCMNGSIILTWGMDRLFTVLIYDPGGFMCTKYSFASYKIYFQSLNQFAYLEMISICLRKCCTWSFNLEMGNSCWNAISICLYMEIYKSYVLKESIKVVILLTLWNYPLLRIVWEIVVLAWVAGCIMILKPSGLPFVSCLKLGQICSATIYLSLHDNIEGELFDSLVKWIRTLYEFNKGQVGRVLLHEQKSVYEVCPSYHINHAKVITQGQSHCEELDQVIDLLTLSAHNHLKGRSHAFKEHILHDTLGNIEVSINFGDERNILKKLIELLGIQFGAKVLLCLTKIRNLTYVKILSKWGYHHLLIEKDLEFFLACEKALAKFVLGMRLILISPSTLVYTDFFISTMIENASLLESLNHKSLQQLSTGVVSEEKLIKWTLSIYGICVGSINLTTQYIIHIGTLYESAKKTFVLDRTMVFPFDPGGAQF